MEEYGAEQSLNNGYSFFSSKQVVFLIVITSLILLGTHLFIFSAIAFILCAYVISFRQGEFPLILIIYTMSFAHIFRMSATSMSYFTFLVLLYVIIIVFKKGTLPTWGVVFAVFVLLIQSINGKISVLEDIKLFGNLLFMYYAFQESEEYEEKRIYISYVLGVIIAAAMRFFDSSFFHISAYAGATEIDYFGDNAVIKSITRFAGIYDDANYFGINIVLALCILFVMYGRRYLSLLATLILTIPLIYYSVLTGSKSVLLMSFLPVCVFFIASHNNKKYFTQLFFMLCILIFIFLFSNGKIHVLDAVLQRMEGKSLSDPNSLTTGRYDVWKLEIQYFLKNIRVLLFGLGVGSSVNKIAAHNVYLELIKYLGVVGTGILVFLFREVYELRENFLKHSFLNSCGILVVLTMYMFLNQLYGFEFPIHFLLAFMMLNTDFERKEGE